MDPPLPEPVKASLLSYLESDAFGGSSRMAIEDVVVVLTDAAVASIPGTSNAVPPDGLFDGLVD